MMSESKKTDMNQTPLLQVKNVKKHFTIDKTHTLHAVDDVSFDIMPGQTVGLVGESGCGKSPWVRL